MKQSCYLKALSLSMALGLTTAGFGFIAFDTASDAVYTVGEEYIQRGTPLGNQTAATNGLNGGFGWNQWLRGGYGTPPNHGTTLITDVNASFNMGAQQFGVRSGANGQNGADARRNLVAPLAIGESLTWSMMAGGNGAGTANTQGDMGAEIRSEKLSNPGRDMLSIVGTPGQNWRIGRNGGTDFTTVAVTPGLRVDVQLTVTGADTFSLRLSEFGGMSDTVNGTFISLGEQIHTLQFFAFQTNGDFYVNNIAAVPEPASILALGGFALMAIRRRKSR